MKSLMTAIILVLAIPTFAANISESDVKSFLNNWLAAQNAGSFANYSVMYAQEFSGIKRSGNKRTTSFNRNAWLEDRKRMFKNKMRVSARNVQINALGPTATVKFEQTWESQGYKDKGEKQLYLVIEKSGLRIKREEMFASKVLAGKGMVLDSINFPFAFAIKEGVIIEHVDIKPEYMKGKPQLSSRDPYYVALSGVNTHLLPKNIFSLIGTPVKIYSAKGVCKSSIEEFKIVVKEVPSDGTQQQWKEELTPSAKIAETVFSEGIPHLIATTKNCSGDFAKDARLPQSPIALGQKVDKKMETKTWSVFTAMPLYRKAIKPFGKNIRIVNMRKFIFPFKRISSVYVTVSVVAGNPLCGAEGGESLGALWEVKKTIKGYEYKEISYLDDQILDYATDIDDDGVPDFHYLSRYRDGSFSFGFIRGDKHNNDDTRFDEAAFNHSPC